MKKQNSLLTLPLPKCLLTRPRIPALLQSSRRKGLVLYRPKRALFLPIKQFKIKRFKILILQNWSWKMTFGASCSRNMKTRWLPYHVTLGMLTGSVHVYTRLWRIAEYVSCLVLGKPRSAWWTQSELKAFTQFHLIRLACGLLLRVLQCLDTVSRSLLPMWCNACQCGFLLCTSTKCTLWPSVSLHSTCTWVYCAVIANFTALWHYIFNAAYYLLTSLCFLAA